jgi:nitrite reductase/ring-hydroxylating ferredoxin subunit
VKQPEAVRLDDVPGGPPRGSVLCRLSDLEPHGSRKFHFHDGLHGYDIFLQRWGERVYAYRDSCPHLKLPLDYRRGHFLDHRRRHLMCAHHGALFRIEDGYCTYGPCKGRWLTPIRIALRGDEIVAD